MADKTVSDLTSATTLDGTELFYLIQSANSRKVAGSEIVKISHNQAWSTITSTPTTLSGYGITDAQALDSDLTAIAALDKTDGNFIVADGTAWTVESGATARASLGLGTAATTAATDYATAAQGATADSALQPGDIGTTVQAQGATLDSLEGLTLASGDVLYATAADTLTNLAKGTEGQVLKVSATGIPEWGTVAGTGDMLAATYDPTSVSGDAFDMANMVEATDAKIMTAAERTKLTGVEAGADVTDAANVDAAGATMNTDTDVSGNSWVLDEDDMASDSATKVPTQQSVKAKIDNDTILKVADRTALKAVDTGAHTVSYLRESGREGQFVWTAGDLSAEVTGDPNENTYVAPNSDPTGASGAWMRVRGVSPTGGVRLTADISTAVVAGDVDAVIASDEAAGPQARTSFWKRTESPAANKLTKTSANGVVFERSGTIKVGEPGGIDPADYGVVWGDTSNQSAKLANAIAAADAGATLRIEGPIHLSNAVSLTKQLKVYGNSRLQSVVTTDGNTAFILSAGINSCGLRDLTIRANGAPRQTNTAGFINTSVDLADNGYIQMFKVNISGFDKAVQLEYAQIAELASCEFEANNIGYYSHRCVNMTLDRCVSQLNQTAGFLINGDTGFVSYSAGTLMSMCTAVQNGANGGSNIKVNFNEYTRIENCMIDVSATGSLQSVVMVGCSRGGINNCWIGASKGEAIKLTTCDSIKVEGNDIVSAATYGVALESSSQCTVSGNTFTANGAQDVLVYGGTAGPRNNLITGNILLSTGSAVSITETVAAQTHAIGNLVKGSISLFTGSGSTDVNNIAI